MSAGRLTTALLVAGAAAAGAPARAQTPPLPATDPAILDGSAQKALDAAKARWKAKGPRSYQLRIARSCFCPEESRGPWTVVVRGGKIVKAHKNVRDIATVPRLFGVVQDAIDRRVQNLSVTYHSKLGYPRNAFVDISLLIADEEQGFTADRFTRL